MDVFVFRCNACGRVAPEHEWVKGKGAQGMGRGGIYAFPKPVCNACNSTSVDLNHDMRDSIDAQEEAKVNAWRTPK